MGNGPIEIPDNKEEPIMKRVKIADHDQLISCVDSLFLVTGNFSLLFCNSFLNESVRMLHDSIVLYEYGYFDNAFYSLRQSVEILNNMLLCSVSQETYSNWKNMKWFPVDSKVRKKLDESHSNYSEIKCALPEYFSCYDELLNRANKYIHKQGFESFRTYIYNTKDTAEKCYQLFYSFFKKSFGLVLLLYISLEPISLCLTDPEVDRHIPYDFMTEGLPMDVLEFCFSQDSIEKIKGTVFYKTLEEYFLSLEELLPATYHVVREQYFDIEHLKEIESQKNNLSALERLILKILSFDLKASQFYPANMLIGYMTNIKSNRNIDGYCSDQFDEFLNRPFESNVSWQGVYISLFHLDNDYLIIEHNEIFSSIELEIIKSAINDWLIESFV